MVSKFTYNRAFLTAKYKITSYLKKYYYNNCYELKVIKLYIQNVYKNICTGI